MLTASSTAAWDYGMFLTPSQRFRENHSSLLGSMSSIKRDVKKKVVPRPEPRCFLEIQPTGIRLR